jgi:hypothetical protein
MHRVEQAVFASPDADQRAGYRVVAQSDGVAEADARELAFWGPTHNSMLAFGPEAESFNFHPLPSGAYCVSHTVSTGWNRSAGRQRVSTQCLIVPGEVLARFGNNPFALLHAASAAGAWQVGDIQESTLEPLLLPGGATPIDQALLAQLALDPGPENIAALVQVAREAACLAISGTPSPVQLIAGLFNCLPPECRLEFSFSTGLKFSPRRPFRIVPLSGDPAEQKWVAHYPNVMVLELHRDESPQAIILDGWSHLIERTLSTGQIHFLAAQASKRRFHLTLDDLPVLGLQLLEELDAALLSDQDRGDTATWDESLAPLESQQQTHAAHRRFGKSAEAAPTATISVPLPSRQLSPGSPEVLEKLEQLDDLVYEAIGGHTELVEQLRVEWPKVMAQLGETLLSESREQYLRYALSIWDECTDANGIRNPTRATHALEVLCVLFGDLTS